jgi:hypothetical protein
MAQTVTKVNLTESEVAERYGVGIRQLRAMRMRNTGPRYVKVSGRLNERGGRILYPRADLEVWFASCPSGGGEGESVSQ